MFFITFHSTFKRLKNSFCYAGERNHKIFCIDQTVASQMVCAISG